LKIASAAGAPKGGRHGREEEISVQTAGEDLLASIQSAESQHREIYQGRGENSQKRIPVDQVTGKNLTACTKQDKLAAVLGADER
jgi:hypothetical protein